MKSNAEFLSTWRPWMLDHVLPFLQRFGPSEPKYVAQYFGVTSATVLKSASMMGTTFEIFEVHDSETNTRIRMIRLKDKRVSELSPTLQIIVNAKLITVRSRNEFNGHHYRKYSQYRKRWGLAIRKLLVPAPKKATIPKVLTVISYRPRLLDEDNLMGGVKPIPDTMKSLGYIVDDTPQWCSIVAKQEQRGKTQACTIITLEDR